MNIYACLHICIYVYMHTYMYVLKCVYVYILLHMYIYTYVYSHPGVDRISGCSKKSFSKPIDRTW